MSDQGIWDGWHEGGGPRYPHENVIQFCFRNYPADVRRRTRVLDLGCGSGVHTVFLAREGFRVTAVDLSPVGVENTRRRLAESNLTAEVRVERLEELEGDAGSIDLVVCVGVLDAAGVDAAAEGTRRVAELLRPGGRGLFVFASERDFRVLDEENRCALHGYTRAEVERVFERPGFARVCYDRYITTYDDGQSEQNDWLITLER